MRLQLVTVRPNLKKDLIPRSFLPAVQFSKKTLHPLELPAPSFMLGGKQLQRAAFPGHSALFHQRKQDSFLSGAMPLHQEVPKERQQAGQVPDSLRIAGQDQQSYSLDQAQRCRDGPVL
ncbi:MAG TPA: hypothetical protein VJ463_06270 [Geothrix sp.]|nr:hypothetical protein [Geothrix sp.]